jgi:hypothetical protein
LTIKSDSPLFITVTSGTVLVSVVVVHLRKRVVPVIFTLSEIVAEAIKVLTSRIFQEGTRNTLFVGVSVVYCLVTTAVVFPIPAIISVVYDFSLSQLYPIKFTFLSVQSPAFHEVDWIAKAKV